MVIVSIGHIIGIVSIMNFVQNEVLLLQVYYEYKMDCGCLAFKWSTSDAINIENRQKILKYLI